MDKRTVSSAHTRIDGLEKEIVAIKTEMDIQFKDLFNRVKRLEASYWCVCVHHSIASSRKHDELSYVG